MTDGAGVKVGREGEGQNAFRGKGALEYPKQIRGYVHFYNKVAKKNRILPQTSNTCWDRSKGLEYDICQDCSVAAE